MTTPALPDGVTPVREPRTDAGGIPFHPVPAWTAAFPWLVHGTTGAAPGTDAAANGGGAGADLGLFGDVPVGVSHERWAALREAVGVGRAVHSRQVHGARIMEHMERLPGLFVTDGCDGHVTGYPGILLTVSVADCVPIFLVDAKLQRVGLLHGGWRGTAAGIVEAGLEAMGADPSRLHAHLGPAICGRCYEVGPEVHEGLGLDIPDGPSPVDLRAVQARRLMDGGVVPERISVSRWCVKHDDGFFSHRGGDGGRQMGVIGVRR